MHLLHWWCTVQHHPSKMESEHRTRREHHVPVYQSQPHYQCQPLRTVTRFEKRQEEPLERSVRKPSTPFLRHQHNHDKRLQKPRQRVHPVLKLRVENAEKAERHYERMLTVLCKTVRLLGLRVSRNQLLREIPQQTEVDKCRWGVKTVVVPLDEPLPSENLNLCQQLNEPPLKVVQ